MPAYRIIKVSFVDLQFSRTYLAAVSLGDVMRSGIDHTGQHAEQDSRRGQHRGVEIRGSSEEVSRGRIDGRV